MSETAFERMYADVPVEQREQLRTFRASHSARHLDVAGQRWPYLAWGSGPRTLLFLAGAFLQADMWFHPITALEKRFRILAPDSNILAGLSARQTLAALPRLLDAEGVEKASLIGLSAGGGLAQLLLQEHPDRVEDVVLSHTGIIESHPEQERQVRRLIWLARLLPGFFVRRTLMKRTSGTLPASSQWRQFHDAFFRESSRVISKTLVIRFLENGLQLRQETHYNPEAIARWDGRMLILNSKDDSVTMASLDKLRQRYPTASVHLFEEGGHHTFMLYPEAYTAALEDFFRI